MSYKLKPTNHLKSLLVFGAFLTLSAALISFSSFRDPNTGRRDQTQRNRTNWNPTVADPLSLDSADTMTTQQIAGKFWQLPLAFEENRGQVESQVEFISRGNGYRLFLTSSEAVITVRSNEIKAGSNGPRGKRRHTGPSLNSDTVLRIKMLGSNSESRPSASDVLPGRVNYLIGNDSKKWRTNIPTFAKIAYPNVYPGINMVYYGNQRQVEYDFVVAPGADPNAIKIAFEFDGAVELTNEGDLVFRSSDAEIRQKKPVVYQDISGIQHEISSRYVLTGNTIAFEVGTYDSTQPLIIDPILLYSTYLGGSGLEFGYDIAVDQLGNVYVVGQVNSTNFPLNNPLQASFAGGDFDGFVSKLNASGSAVEYSTYLGGNAIEFCEGVAVDSSGSVYVTGITNSLNFPVTQGAIQTDLGGGDCGSVICSDAFIAKLNKTGSGLVFSTFLGGSGFDDGRSIKVDASGYSYVTGVAETGFPTTVGAFETAGRGGFVSKLNKEGSALVYSTILRGANLCQSLAVDAAGNAYVTGRTFDPEFPTTPGAFQTISDGSGDAFVTKFNPAGSSLIYSTLLGGGGLDSGFGIAVDSHGSAYVTGETQLDINRPPAFPTTSGSLQISFGGGHADLDGFVTKINPEGSNVVYSTLLGGNAPDRGSKIAVDNCGNAFVAGWTQSSNFHLLDAIQVDLRGGEDAFVTKINATGSGLIYSTYLGGSSGDQAEGLALDALGNAYVLGATQSWDFPTMNPAQQTYGGGTDTFIAKIGFPQRNKSKIKC